MNLTIRSNHAIRLLTYCALEPGRVATVAEIAKACNSSENHLAKIANRLSQMGCIETLRGRRGGVRLAKPAAEINIGAVVRASEPDDSMVECFNEETNTCPLVAKCRFKLILRHALDAFYGVLDGYTLADLLVDAEELRVMLGFETPGACALASHADA